MQSVQLFNDGRANDGVLQANATKMLVNECEMLVNDLKCTSMMVK